MRARTLGLLVLALAACACQKAPALDDDLVVYSVENSTAFQKVDPGVVFVDATFRPGQSAKREMRSLEHVDVKDDGPFGIAGQTAVATFTWRWTGGPYAGRVFRSSAKFNSAGGSWKLYEDTLRDDLWRAERGESD